MTKKILLCCSMGMSSGFLATNTRKAAKKAGLDYDIEARSETGISDYMSSIDMLLLGAHLSSMLDKYRKMGAEHNVPVEMIPDDIYGMLDGEGLLKIIRETLHD